MRFDDAVHQRLSCTGLIRFVVSATAITNQIDDDVFLEPITVIRRQLADEQDGFRIVTVHVENRCIDHFCHVSAVFGRAGVFGVRGGETHLVIDHDMNRTAGLVRPSLAGLEGL